MDGVKARYAARSEAASLSWGRVARASIFTEEQQRARSVGGVARFLSVRLVSCKLRNSAASSFVSYRPLGPFPAGVLRTLLIENALFPGRELPSRPGVALDESRDCLAFFAFRICAIFTIATPP